MVSGPKNMYLLLMMVAIITLELDFRLFFNWVIINRLFKNVYIKNKREKIIIFHCELKLSLSLMKNPNLNL